MSLVDFHWLKLGIIGYIWFLPEDDDDNDDNNDDDDSDIDNDLFLFYGKF